MQRPLGVQVRERPRYVGGKRPAALIVRCAGDLFGAGHALGDNFVCEFRHQLATLVYARTKCSNIVVREAI